MENYKLQYYNTPANYYVMESIVNSSQCVYNVLNQGRIVNICSCDSHLCNKAVIANSTFNFLYLIAIKLIVPLVLFVCLEL